ncbi:MAG: hypothetical protein KAU03_02125, partial [Candidatus Altiarchaeales archaeon]|nr:hypothetical protein [Candidatus Altiarchaeales archaeon]
DGYLSHPGVPGGGSEECDPNTGPYNNWSGAKEYPCPGGLECVNCKCVGCGDGRLQQQAPYSEGCDQWRYKVKVNGEYLWEGDLIDCSGEDYKCNWDTCKCIEKCGDGVLDSGETCEVGIGCPTYHNCNMETCQCELSCTDFCGSRGDGYTNYPGATTQAECSEVNSEQYADGGSVYTRYIEPYSKLEEALMEISEVCCASCGSAAMYGSAEDVKCCCIKTNKVCPCDYCPCTVGVDCHLMTCEPQSAACMDGLQ